MMKKARCYCARNFTQPINNEKKEENRQKAGIMKKAKAGKGGNRRKPLKRKGKGNKGTTCRSKK